MTGSPPPRPAPVPGARYAERLTRIGEETRAAGLDALLVGVGPDLEYLTGYEAKPLERLTLLVVPASAPPVLIVPRLERAAAEAGRRTPVTIRTWDETDDPYRLVLAALPGEPARLAVSERLWASHLLALQASVRGASDGGSGGGAGGVAGGVAWSPATPVLRRLRMAKGPEEIALLRAAAHAADRVVSAIAAGPLVGRTEADVAREVRERLLAEGHDEASFWIVGSGPNSASPHHDASERRIQAGEPIVLDIGGRLGGYGSDITRTIWVTGGDPAKGPDPAFRRLYDVLREAQQAATAAVRPGVPAGAIDVVARDRITAAGYGELFIHRTGHGIGLEGHEEPYLVAGNDEPLEVGHAFSVEPGIYVEGRYGARIEDIVVCGPDGPDVLNEIGRELLVVDG